MKPNMKRNVKKKLRPVSDDDPEFKRFMGNIKSDPRLFCVDHKTGRLVFNDCIVEPTMLEVEILRTNYINTKNPAERKVIAAWIRDVKRRLKYIKKHKIDVRPSRDFAGLP